MLFVFSSVLKHCSDWYLIKKTITTEVIYKLGKKDNSGQIFIESHCDL